MEESERFCRWYKEPIEALMPNEHAGFAILILTFPILERYLRRKLKIADVNLCSRFYDELLQMFPDLRTVENAKSFWKIYRHGLIHQATLQAPDGVFVFVNNDVPIAFCSPDGRQFGVSPKQLASHVLKIIEENLPTFEDPGNRPLATVVEHPPSSGVQR